MGLKAYGFTYMNHTPNRIHAMDMLRSVAMYLGIILHAVIVYQVAPRPGWAVDGYSNIFFDFYYQFAHSFRMQLFYLVAGYFGRLLYLKIGQKDFIIHRTKRILGPFIVGTIHHNS